MRGQGSPGLWRDADGALVYDAYEDARRSARVGEVVALGSATLGPRVHAERLRLVVYSTHTEETVTLDGPLVEGTGLERAFALPPVRTRELSLLQTLNPLQEGGLWRTLAKGMRYDWCRTAGTAARERFDARVRTGTLDAKQWE